MRDADVADGDFDKIRDANSYAAHAAIYDKYIRTLAGPLADQLCRLADVRPGNRVLDVGTGTGIGARCAARLVGPTGSVLGIDLSEAMIDVARESVAGWESGSPEFRVMDAEALDVPDQSYDVVISLCAVRHFPNIQRALLELFRVARPGARIVISYGYPRPIAPVALVSLLARRLLGVLANPIRPRIVGSAYLTRRAQELLPEPPEAIDTEWGAHDPRGALVSYLKQAGFNEVEVTWWGHEVVFEDPEEFWEAQTAIVTQARKRIINAPADAVVRLKNVFLRRARDVVRRGGRLIYPYGAILVSARRP